MIVISQVQWYINRFYGLASFLEKVFLKKKNQWKIIFAFGLHSLSNEGLYTLHGHALLLEFCLEKALNSFYNKMLRVYLPYNMT